MAEKNDICSWSAKEIEKMLTNWAQQGRITSKTLMGRDYLGIKKKYAEGKLFVTGVDGIDVLDEEAQSIFEILHDSKRVMTARDVMVQSGLTTSYAINKAVKEGGLIRFDLLGKSSILYIA